MVKNLAAVVALLVTSSCGDGSTSGGFALPTSSTVQTAFNVDDPHAARLTFSFTPDPVSGSRQICGGAFWGTQTPTWSMVETIRETHGVGFTLKKLTYNYYNQHGALVSTITFNQSYYFAPYDEDIEDGCVALHGSPSGTFEEIDEGVDDNGNQLTFIGRVSLLPVPER